MYYRATRTVIFSISLSTICMYFSVCLSLLLSVCPPVCNYAFLTLRVTAHCYKSIKESINQVINQSRNQSINQSVSQSVNQSISQSVSRQSIGQSAGSQSVSQQGVSRLVSRQSSGVARQLCTWGRAMKLAPPAPSLFFQISKFSFEIL